MEYEPKKVYRGRPAAAGTTLYTVPVGKTAIVKSIVLFNGTAATASIDLHNIASGGALSDDNQFWGDSLAPNETVTIDLSDVMETGDFLRAVASGDNTIAVQVSAQVTV